ncbi:hypothetical protein C4K68_09420 [Pokkaliibacter plantistimulans]|uniref:Uncharacterized protein n=1 Tax=Proteobacteria bacterium 228 TaxID=2083153 RepID=A0A2S5KS61_9PROT|nr:hypothetical protein C4K68_09420 [Pokkaliibacter plantistimulans]
MKRMDSSFETQSVPAGNLSRRQDIEAFIVTAIMVHFIPSLCLSRPTKLTVIGIMNLALQAIFYVMAQAGFSHQSPLLLAIPLRD